MENEVVEEVTTTNWLEIDRTLCGLAKQRAALDVEEARWLRAAQRLQIWREVGCVSLLDYMERRLGYGPRAAQERLRVAGALEQLPALELALGNGDLPFTAARELSRVMTPETEGAWLEAGRDKSVHEIEKLVAGHEKGDLPEDPPKPELERRVLRFEVRPATLAFVRKARAALEAAIGDRLDDDAFIAALCAASLEGNDSKPGSVAKYQIATIICVQCKRGQRDANGVTVDLDAADVERAECDAQRIGRIDAGGHPDRATQDIPPRTRRLVWRRDHERCVVPGCRSSKHLERHHIVPREAGGRHDPENLCLLCGAHHDAHHRGLLEISGTAPGKLAFKRRDGAHVGAPSQLAIATMRVEARSALVKLGYTPSIASAAVQAAYAPVGVEVTLERLVREALRRCSGGDP